ncbi:MAG: hypothetical protein M5U26_07455 [Planctomycetota bacterium]|nr:hypothetical protein [Planctomycetota bacterium]
MSSRAFCFTLETPAGASLPALEAWAASARLGALEGPGDAWPRASVAAVLEALRKADKASCWVDAGAGEAFDLHATCLERSGAAWRVSPPKRALDLESVLKGQAPRGAEGVLAAAHALLRNEPWEAFFLRLAANEASVACVDDALARLLAGLTPDIAVWGFRLGSGRVVLRQGSAAAPLPACGQATFLPTALRLMGVAQPDALPGAPLDLEATVASGYSREDEEAIQARLEDLGYV